MSHAQITISGDFRKMTFWAIQSIVLFVLIYIILFLLSLGLTILSGYAGIMLIILKPTAITIMVGLGLISMGLIILIFLVKFIFKSHAVDRSHLTEITREEEPRLYSMLDTIVEEVNTTFPKRVYLSADVNACVFYDSTFWSMFLPIKKNLQIGIGLVSSVTESEFKSILAHEFGHFSQRSMKVGSYVYNVNQIIFNMLYDNDSYMLLAQRWANISGYFSFFIGLAVKVVSGIQWLLRKVYSVVNLNYLALSREMEFHADEVAANVTGSEPLVTSLLRLDLANSSFNSVVSYYDNKVSESIITANIYAQQ